MPIYEYRCNNCRRRVSVLVRSFSSAVEPVCEHCGSRDLRRLLSRFTHVRSWGGSLDDVPDSAFDDVDESDPKEMARWMRRLKAEMGDEVGPEFDQMVEELEQGHMPDDLEGDLEDEDGDSAGGDKLDDG